MVNSLEQFKWSVLITASVLFFVGMVSGKSVKYNFEEIYQEEPCLARSGFCTPLQECPKRARYTARGLCPRQEAEGIECCKELSTKAWACEKQGGSCFPARRRCFNLAALDAECPPEYSCCFIPDLA